MRSFDLTVMPGSERADELVNGTTLFEACHKQRGCAAERGKAVDELRTIIRLNTLNIEMKSLEHMIEEDSRRISIGLVKALNAAKAGEFINSGILIKFMGTVRVRSCNTVGWNVLDVDLHSLTGVCHGFIRLGYIFRIRQLYRCSFQTFQHAV